MHVISEVFSQWWGTPRGSRIGISSWHTGLCIVHKTSDCKNSLIPDCSVVVDVFLMLGNDTQNSTETLFLESNSCFSRLSSFVKPLIVVDIMCHYVSDWLAKSFDT